MDAEITGALHTAIRGSKTRDDIRIMQLLLSSLPQDEAREALERALVEKAAELFAGSDANDGHRVS